MGKTVFVLTLVNQHRFFGIFLCFTWISVTTIYLEKSASKLDSSPEKCFKMCNYFVVFDILLHIVL